MGLLPQSGQCTLAIVSRKSTDDRYAQLRQTCLARGLRLTLQRDVLLRALSRTMGHPTADDLVKKVRKVLPTVSHATVYRNVTGTRARRSDRHAGAQRRRRPVRNQSGSPPSFHVRALRAGVGRLPRSGRDDAGQTTITVERIPDRSSRRAAAWPVRALPRPPLVSDRSVVTPARDCP